jgi:hypothetical protein
MPTVFDVRECSDGNKKLYAGRSALITMFQAVAEEEVHRSVVHNHEDQAGSSFDLDFRKIKQHLLCGSVKTKLLLFQALRWVKSFVLGKT